MFRSIFIINILFLGIGAFLSVHAQQTQVKTVAVQISEHADAHIHVYDQWMSALVADELEQAQTLMHTDFATNGETGEFIGAGDFLSIWKGYHDKASEHTADLSVMAVQIGEGLYEGEWVLSWGTASWTPNATQKPILSYVHHIAKIEEGQISLVYTYQDALAIMTQMGFSLQPPASAGTGK